MELKSIDALVAEAAYRLSREREDLLESFLVSGAMPWDLVLAVHPLESRVLQDGAGYFVNFRQQMRIV